MHGRYLLKSVIISAGTIALTLVLAPCAAYSRAGVRALWVDAVLVGIMLSQAIVIVWHDPAYRDELEMTGQVRSLNYLKDCRGGAWAEPVPG